MIGPPNNWVRQLRVSACPAAEISAPPDYQQSSVRRVDVHREVISLRQKKPQANILLGPKETEPNTWTKNRDKLGTEYFSVPYLFLLFCLMESEGGS